MAFKLKWTQRAAGEFVQLKNAALSSPIAPRNSPKRKASRQQGLFKQITQSIARLADNPRHPSLNTHKYSCLPHPWKKGESVFEAYAQNHTPGAYRIFFCYGPDNGEITIIAITSHP